MLKWDCQHPNNTNLHSPFQLSPSHFSLFGSSVLSISAMWLTGVVWGGGLSWQPDPNTWPACSKAGSRKRTAHTGHHGNTPPRGPSAARPFPETLVPALWLDLANLLRLSLFLSPRHLPSPLLCVPLCVLVCLPVCELESSPGPGRQSCPLRCGTLLWSLRRWRCCLDWASTGDTSPTNTQTQSVLFTSERLIHLTGHNCYSQLRGRRSSSAATLKLVICSLLLFNTQIRRTNNIFSPSGSILRTSRWWMINATQQHVLLISRELRTLSIFLFEFTPGLMSNLFSHSQQHDFYSLCGFNDYCYQFW